MFKKHLLTCDILSEDTGHRPPSLLKMSLFEQLPGFYISQTLVVNRLKKKSRYQKEQILPVAC